LLYFVHTVTKVVGVFVRFRAPLHLLFTKRPGRPTLPLTVILGAV
jgi:hypothetical protein